MSEAKAVLSEAYQASLVNLEQVRQKPAVKARQARIARDVERNSPRKRLRSILRHALRSVPFYDARVAREDEEASLDQFPLLRKQDIRTEFPDLISRDRSGAMRSGQLYATRTSGSTGQPCTTLRDENTAHWDSVGLHSIAKEMRVPADRDVWNIGLHGEDDPLFDVDALSPGALTIRLPRVDLSYDDTDEFFSAIAEISTPGLILGASQRLIALAQLLERLGYRPQPSVVLASYEHLAENDRLALERFFRAPVRRWYGTAETGMAGWECANGRLHFNTDLVAPELLEREGAAERSIILTSLTNRVMPIIRYETGDLAEGSLEDPCSCERSHQPSIGALVGRVSVNLVDRDGAKLSPYPVLEQVAELGAVPAFQLVQEQPGHVLVCVEGEAPDNAFLLQLLDWLKFTPQRNLTFEFRGHAAWVTATNGKRNPVVQRIVET